jgi:pimeloyl-ACP methyl ester carboxylesterase
MLVGREIECARLAGALSRRSSASGAVVAVFAILLTGLPAGAARAAGSPSAYARVGRLAPLPPLAKRCGLPGVRAKPFYFKAIDGVLLDGAVLGHGQVGVVLAHQYGVDLCSSLPYALLLSRDGLRVLVFDFRGFGLSTPVTGKRSGRLDADVAGAITELRRRGAGKIVIVGMSIGGSAVLAAAATSQPPVAGVVSVSAPDSRFLRESASEYAVLNPTAAVARIRSPLLFLHAKDDPIVAVASSRRLYRAATVSDKRLVIASGSSHGILLVNDPPTGTRLQKLILKFIRDHTGS